MTPADDHELRAVIEFQLGRIYTGAGDTRQAFHHFQQSIQHCEAWGDIERAGAARANIAILLADDGRISDALQYARAALDNFQQVGTAAKAAAVEQLIARLEQRGH